MNLHEASRRYEESQLKPEERDEPKTVVSDVARPGVEAVERTLPPREYFPLGGFQLEHQDTRMTVGLDRYRTRIWRSMRAKQLVRNGAVQLRSNYSPFNLIHVFLVFFHLCESKVSQ